MQNKQSYEKVMNMLIEHQGLILWFTGFSGPRNTKLAELLNRKLVMAGAKVQILDVDQLWAYGHGKKHFSQNDRVLQMEMIAEIALMLKRQGVICIVIYEVPREKVQQGFLREIDAIEVIMNANVQERDRGVFPESSGVYHSPANQAIHLQTDKEAPEESCGKCYDFLIKNGYIDEIGGYYGLVYNPNSFEKVLGRFPFPSLMLLRSRRGRSFKEGVTCFVDDCLQFFKLRRYPYKNKVIFIAALPKSGSTWLEEMLGIVPGYKVRHIYDPSRSTSSHDVSPLTFEFLPDYAYSVIKLHTRYTPDNFNTIIDKVGKFVVLYRDLRDMCVSRYYHVMNLKEHRHNKLYNTLSRDDSLFHCMNIIKNEYIDWVQKWYEAASIHPDNVLLIRYEDLIAKVSDTMKRVLDFFDIPGSENIIKKMSQTQLKGKVNFKKSLVNGYTKRKGAIGDWKNLFSEKHKNYFKKIAGDLLIRLGYETDINW